jgi:hypothetical protein
LSRPIFPTNLFSTERCSDRALFRPSAVPTERCFDRARAIGLPTFALPAPDFSSGDVAQFREIATPRIRRSGLQRRDFGSIFVRWSSIFDRLE